MSVVAVEQQVFVARLPHIEHGGQIAKWARERLVDFKLVLGIGCTELWGVHRDIVEKKKLQALLCNNCKNWGITESTYKRGWLGTMSVHDYIERVGPSDDLKGFSAQVVGDVVARASQKIYQDAAKANDNARREREQRHRESDAKKANEQQARDAILSKMVLHIDFKIRTNRKDVKRAAWDALSRPLRIRFEEARRAEDSERKRLEEEDSEKRARLLAELEERKKVSGVWTSLPCDLSAIESLDDIPAVRRWC